MSESTYLTLALARLHSANLSILEDRDQEASKEIDKAVTILETLRKQADQGKHRNPALVVYGNPGGRGLTVGPGSQIFLSLGQVLGRVERLDYDRMLSPRGGYFHEFGPDDILYTATLEDGTRVILIANTKGQKLWGSA